jgi:predicted CoA-binding protein
VTEFEILEQYHTIAVVGLTSDESRAAYSVSEYMQRAGYRIIPIAPGETEVLGERAYPDLQSVPEPIDIVDIFKRSEEVPPFVDDAIESGAKVVWMQLGIENEAAAAKARAAGLEVVMDTCIRTMHRRMTAE